MKSGELILGIEFKRCKERNCNNKHYAKGYCNVHYARMRRYIKKYNFKIEDDIESLDIELLINLIKAQIYLKELGYLKNMDKLYKLITILKNKLIEENDN